jgi:DNA-binding XRE family transcriptional regulator
MMDLSPFTRAGLRQGEIGQLVGVTQTTVGLWMRGKRSPHFLIAPRIAPILSAVESAVDDGALPLKATVPREQRLAKIKRVVNKHLRAKSR